MYVVWHLHRNRIPYPMYRLSLWNTLKLLKCIVHAPVRKIQLYRHVGVRLEPRYIRELFANHYLFSKLLTWECMRQMKVPKGKRSNFVWSRLSLITYSFYSSKLYSRYAAACLFAYINKLLVSSRLKSFHAADKGNRVKTSLGEFFPPLRFIPLPFALANLPALDYPAFFDDNLIAYGVRVELL